MSPSEEPTAVGALVDDARTNAVLGWVVVVVLLLVAVVNAMTGRLLWAGFAAVVCALALVVPAGYRTSSVMLPWEVLALASLPLLGRTVARVPVTSDLATYLSVAAVALVVAVELQLFTPVRMTPRFAVGFVVVATLAAAGAWAVARFALDSLLGTTFLLDPALSESAIEESLMLEFVYSTAAGFLAGLLFEGYFRRRRGRETVLPPEVDA